MHVMYKNAFFPSDHRVADGRAQEDLPIQTSMAKGMQVSFFQSDFII